MKKSKLVTLVAAVLMLSLTSLTSLAPIAPAGAIEQPEVDIDNLNMVPERIWGVSGQNPADTQTPSLDVLVWDFAQIGNRMFVGGAFLNVQESKLATPISQPYVAAFDLNTGDWIDTWRPQLDRAVYSLDVLPSGKLLVGGEFETVNGTNREGLVALDPNTGAIDPGFAGSVERPWSDLRAMVRDMDVVGNQIYIAGNFSHLNGINGSRTRVYKAGRFTNNGTIDAGWLPQITGSSVWGLDVDQSRGEVHLAGYFTAVNGEADTGHFHTVNNTSGASAGGKIELPRNYTKSQPEMFDVVAGNGTVFVIGEQHITQVLNASNHQMMGFHGTGYENDGFEYEGGFSGGAFQAGEKIGNIVFAGCHCTRSERFGMKSHYSSFNGQRTGHRLVMAYDATTGQHLQQFTPDIHSPRDGTWAIASDTNGCVYVGGDFHVGGVDHGLSRWLGGFGKFCPNDFNPGNGGGPEVPVDADTLLAAEGSWTYSDSAQNNSAWTQAAFNDAAWATSNAEFGFGDNDETTQLAKGKTTYYFRNSFEFTGAKPTSLKLDLKADDGAVVYLNGKELFRDNMPNGTITSSTRAADWRAGADEDFQEYFVSPDDLIDGTNVVAVEVHNFWAGNNDLSFDLGLGKSDQAPTNVPVVVGELVELGSSWKSADSSGGSAPANWKNGLTGTASKAEFGFGENDQATTLTPGQETYYFTQEFDVADAAAFTNLSLGLLADDGAVVYLNGTEVKRFNMPAGTINWNTRPSNWVGGRDETLATSSIPATALVDGKNVIAVEVHNFWPGNPDLSFDLKLQ